MIYIRTKFIKKYKNTKCGLSLRFLTFLKLSDFNGLKILFCERKAVLI